jgi:integrase
LKVLALLGQRPGEIVGMRRSELVSLETPGAARWEIPAERMKGRKSHIVPLPERARRIILEQAAHGDRLGEYVFVSKFEHRDRLARHSLSQGLRRVIANMVADDENAATVATLQTHPPTPHDFRRTLATGLARLGISREDRLAVLAHSHGDVHRAHYDRYERLREKRVALEAWECHVAEVLREGKSDSKIVPVGRGQS